MNNKIKLLTKTAILTSLLFVLTSYVSIPIKFGYLNLSDAFIMIISNFLPLNHLIFVSSFATMLSDIYLGYSEYAVFTFVIKGLEAFVIYKLNQKLTFKYSYLISFITGGLFMLVGYGIADVIIKNNIIYFITSFMANLPQAIASVLLAAIIHNVFKKVGLNGTK